MTATASPDRGLDRRGGALFLDGFARNVARCLAAVVAVVVAVSGLVVVGAQAASAAAMRTWTGGGTTGLWTEAANWGGTAPNAGDDLVFPAGAARTVNSNNFPAGTAFNSLHFGGDANNYAIGGNLIALGAGGISTDTGSNAPRVRLGFPIRLTANENFTFGYFGASSASFSYSTIDLAGFTVHLAGTASASGTHRVTGGLSGNGGLVVATQNYQYASVILGGTNTSTGITTVGGAATLYVDSDYSTRLVRIAGDAILGGSGKVGPVAALTIGSSVFTSNETAHNDILTVNGALSMGDSSNYFVNIIGAAPGTGYGQTVVNGRVSLSTGGALVVNGAYHPYVGQTFTIIANHGTAAVSGAFEEKPEGSILTDFDSNATYRITYKGGASGHDVVFTAVTTGH